MKKIQLLQLIVFLLISSLADAQIIESSDIKNKEKYKIILTLKIDRVVFFYNNELLLSGQINIKNISNKTISLPKTFDLDITLKDGSNKLLFSSEYIIYEHVNLIQNNRKTKIKPNKSADFQFIEAELSDYNLKISQEYFIRYSLNTENLLTLKDSNTYHSNFYTFILPPGLHLVRKGEVSKFEKNNK